MNDGANHQPAGEGSSESAPTPGAAPSAGIRTWVKRSTIAVLSCAGVALVGGLVAWNLDGVKAWWSATEPLDQLVSVDHDTAPSNGGWQLFVANRDLLPVNLSDINTCDELWEVGIRAGGVRSDSMSHNILLTGKAEEGITILDVRAVVESRSQAKNGVHLDCPSAGSVTPISLQIDLTESNTAEAQHVVETVSSNDSTSTTLVDRFASGYVIDIQQNEPVSLNVEAHLPAEAIEWHLVADIRVRGETKQVRIDNNGVNFASPGRLPLSGYDEGHSAGVSHIDWGIDRSATHQSAEDGTDLLVLGGVAFPNMQALDFYQQEASYGEPRLADGNSALRWLRHNGRVLVGFNPHGVPVMSQPEQHDYCREPIEDREGYKRIAEGRIREIAATKTSVHHGDQVFDHSMLQIYCSFSSTNQARDSEDIDSYEFWACQGMPCVEKVLEFEVAQRRGSDIMYSTLYSDVEPVERDTARRMIKSVIELPNPGPPPSLFVTTRASAIPTEPSPAVPALPSVVPAPGTTIAATDLSGINYGMLKNVPIGQSIIEVDVVQRFEGDAAIQACEEDGVVSARELCATFYHRNVNPLLRILQVAPAVEVEVMDPGVYPNKLRPAGLADLKQSELLLGRIFELTVQDGAVTRIIEVAAR